LRTPLRSNPPIAQTLHSGSSHVPQHSAVVEISPAASSRRYSAALGRCSSTGSFPDMHERPCASPKRTDATNGAMLVASLQAITGHNFLQICVSPVLRRPLSVTRCYLLGFFHREDLVSVMLGICGVYVMSARAPVLAHAARCGLLETFDVPRLVSHCQAIPSGLKHVLSGHP
jgi:hypothetical protein